MENIFIEKEKAVPLYFEQKATSSFDKAYELDKEKKLPEWASVLVEQQTNGRGQMQKNWHSPLGNIYATLKLPYSEVFRHQSASLIIGAMVISCLEKIKKNSFEGKKLFFLKWTNDICVLHKNRYHKICGILLEERNKNLYVGIGLNLKNYPEFNNTLSENILPAYYALPYLKDEFLSIKSLWIRLVQSLYMCYEKQVLNELMQGKNNINFHEETCVFIKYWLSMANNHLAFKDSLVTLSQGLLADDMPFDYDENNEQIHEYIGYLRNISLHEPSTGGIVIDTPLGRRVFVGGRIKPIV